VFEISADRATNRLYIDITGSVEREEMEATADTTISEAETLREGFDIVNDHSGFRPLSPEAVEPIKAAQEELKQMGLSRTVRVVDDETSSVVVNAFERRSRDVGYSAEQADSVAAAEELLAETEASGFN